MVFATDITDLGGNLLGITQFGPHYRLRRIDGRKTLPGQPRASLQSPDLLSYLRQAHSAFHLDKLSPHLWLVSKPYYGHISPLHHQAVRGRNVVVAENPHLHLVWHYNRIFIKPIPPYMLSRAFWEYLETEDKELFYAAAGFMRTYSLLIQFEIDFRKATSPELGLIPVSSCEEPITFETFTSFIAPFAGLSDNYVSPRYQYGELRLTRLNWLARIFLGKLTFHHMHAQWGSCLGRILSPFLTVFIIVSTILNAMQVELAAQSLPYNQGRWNTLSDTAHWFAVVVLFISALVLVIMGGLILFMISHDQWFALSVLRKRNKLLIQAASEMRSGVV